MSEWLKVLLCGGLGCVDKYEFLLKLTHPGSETGFFYEILGHTAKFGKKPGFFGGVPKQSIAPKTLQHLSLRNFTSICRTLQKKLEIFA
ncbi:MULTISPECIES: hypothetical protein [unclassified Microcoleus]|uniref:hypothetical protein n=1 Tax=unclassified Microcoleus TaxID=2642155 RepID=UPI0025F5B304|nr:MULTISPECIES: hypothetical protein [unclassified Microcoleus]